MPSHAQILPDRLVRALKARGFVEHHQVGSHLTLKNVATGRRTTVPMHKKPLGKGLLSAILRQAGLAKGDLAS